MFGLYLVFIEVWSHRLQSESLYSVLATHESSTEGLGSRLAQSVSE